MTVVNHAGAAAGLLAATLFSTACASALIPPGAPSAAEVETGRAAYTTVLEQVYGTAPQRAAAEERGWILVQAALSECVTKAGSTYGMAPYPGGLSYDPSPGDLLAFAPFREDFGVASGLTARASKPEGLNAGLAAAGTEAEREAYFEALQGCQSAATPFEGTNVPPGQEALTAKHLAALERVQEQATPTLRADYVRCLREAGITAADRPELYGQVGYGFPVVPTGNSDPAALPGWDAAVAFERKAAAADAACRAEAVDVAMAAVPAELEKFSTAYAGELASVARGWAQAEADVKALRAKYKLE